MKSLSRFALFFLASAFVFSLSSCGGGGSKKGLDLTKIESGLKKKFGDDAHYTDIAITPDKTVGNMISATVTDDPASLKLGEYLKMRGVWEQKADVTLEIGSGEAADYMFTLNEVSFTKLAELVEASKQKLADEKDLADTRVRMISLKTPSRGTKEDMDYYISLEPENGGTDFTFTYNMDGTLENFDY